MMTPEQRLVYDAILNDWAKRGKVVEGGFAAYKVVMDLPPDQVVGARFAYMTGAQHLFASMMAIMDAGEEITPGDLMGMDKINKELEAFVKEAHEFMKKRGQH